MDRLNKILSRLNEKAAFTPNAAQKIMADNLVKAFEKNISQGHGGKVVDKKDLVRAVYEYLASIDIPTNRPPPWAAYLRDRLLKSGARFK